MNDARGDLLLGSAPFASPPTVADVPLPGTRLGNRTPAQAPATGSCASPGDPLNPFIEYGVVNAQVMVDHQQSEQPYFWLGERGARNVAEPLRGRLRARR